MIIWNGDLSKHLWSLLSLGSFIGNFISLCAISVCFNSYSAITKFSRLVLHIKLYVLRIAKLNWSLRLLVQRLKIIHKLANVTKVHGIFLFSLPSLFFLLFCFLFFFCKSLFFNLFILFFFSFFGFLFLIFLALCLLFLSLFFFSLALKFLLSLFLSLFFSFLLLCKFFLFIFFFHLLIHELLSKDLCLLFCNLSSLLFGQLLSLLFGLNGNYFLSFFFLYLLKLLCQFCLGFSNCLSLLFLLFFNSFLLELTLFFEGFLSSLLFK